MILPSIFKTIQKPIFLLLVFLLPLHILSAQVITKPSEASSLYDAAAVKCFIPLGAETGGETFLSDPEYGIIETLIEIINTKVEDNTDFMLVIDQTGSMSDDIDMVKRSLVRVVDALNQWNNIRLGVALYGDKNVDGPGWFEFQDLNEDFEPAGQFIQEISVSGGGDHPESVYDGVMRTMTTASWRKGNKHMMLTIGDAPSLVPPKSNHSFEEVISYCGRKDVDVNLYPVLIDMR